MSLIEQIPLIGPFASSLIPFLFVLGIVVAIHEYGHYIVAKWCGVYSKVFSVGFGPELFGWTDKHNTRWKVCLIPLGGYVLFHGLENELSTGEDEKPATQEQAAAEPAPAQPTSAETAKPVHAPAPPPGMIGFPEASVGRRAAIAFAGPLANFILTVVLLAGTAMIVGLSSNTPIIGEVREGTEGARAGFEAGDRLLALDGVPVEGFENFSTTIFTDPGRSFDVEIERAGEVFTLPFTYEPPVTMAQVVQGSAADDAGLEIGDVILAVDGEDLRTFEELREKVIASRGAPLTVRIDRDGVEQELEFAAQRRELRLPDGEIVERFQIGVRADPLWGLQNSLEPAGPIEALQHGVSGVGRIITGTVFGLYEMIMGRGDTGEMGGPIRIAQMSGEAAKDGFSTLIQLTALLSTSIGLLNLFPIPILDGGHLLFYAIEALRGKPLNRRAHEFLLMIGFSLIISLMIFATWNDIAS